MEKGINSLMEDLRSERLEKTRKNKLLKRCSTVLKLLNARIDALPRDILPPPVGNIIAFAAFQEVILKTPIDEQIGDEMLDRPFEGIRELAIQWRNDADRDLLEVMRKYNFKDDVTPNDLHLAGLLFFCSKCSSSLMYPLVLLHTCCYWKHQYTYTNGPSPGTADEFSFMANRFPWSSEVLSIGTLENVADIIRVCGLDPSTATANMMDELDPFMEELAEDNHSEEQNQDPNPRRTVYHNWRNAMKSQVRHQSFLCLFILINGNCSGLCSGTKRPLINMSYGMY